MLNKKHFQRSSTGTFVLTIELFYSMFNNLQKKRKRKDLGREAEGHGEESVGAVAGGI